jgi:hypothetical protein
MQPSAMSRGGGSEEGDALAVPPPPWQQQQQQQQQQLRRDYGSASSVTGSAALEAPSGCIDGGHPCCILWTPIHPITWFAPFVGHMGVCDSSGRLHDWGPKALPRCLPFPQRTPKALPLQSAWAV